MPNNFLREEEEKGIRRGKEREKRGGGKDDQQFVEIAVMSTQTGNSYRPIAYISRSVTDIVKGPTANLDFRR